MKNELEVMAKIEELQQEVFFINGSIEGDELEGDVLTHVVNINTQIEALEWVL